MNKASIKLTLAACLLAGTAWSQEPAGKLSMDIHFGPRAKEDVVAKWGPDKLPSPGYAIKADKIFPISGDPIYQGVILTKDSKILAVGSATEISIPANFKVFDMGDSWVLPGFVDLHCHVAAGMGDLNDSAHATNPELRTLDLVDLDRPTMRRALAGGVTTVLLLPGSATNMGGFSTLTKAHGKPDEALIRFPGSLKIAQAGNPERRAGDLGMSRRGMNQNLRFTLERGQRYYQAWEDHALGKGPKPKFQAELEYLRGLFRHEYPVTVHTQAYQVALETIRQLRGEFGLWTVIDHGTFDAYRLSGFAKKMGVPVCNGPRQYHFDRQQSRFIGLAAAWYAGGRHGWQEDVAGLGIDGIGINTDSPVVAQEQLSLQAAMSVRLGLPFAVGLRALTLNPARFIGIEHRLGSLQKGMDADVVVWSGDPLDPRSHVILTLVNGRIAYQRQKDRPLF